MPNFRRTTFLSLALLAVAGGQALAQAAEPLAGLWKGNMAKSTFEPTDLAAKSSTVTYAFSANKVTATIDQVNAKGQKVHIAYTATLDGADSPWASTTDGKASTSQDAVTFKKLGPNTYHVENKLKGKVLTVNHIVVAADGKSRTSTTNGTNADGVKVHNVVHYDKQ